MVVNLKTKKVRQITDGSAHFDTNGDFSYRWSPDGKWFTLEFVGNRHDPYYDIGLVSAEGGKPITNLTNSGYMNNNPRFVMDGKAILWEMPSSLKTAIRCFIFHALKAATTSGSLM